MDPLTAIEIPADDPRVKAVVAKHLELMRASSPVCSVHAMEADDLASANATFFAVLDEGIAAAIGALKPLPSNHGELKSMHVIQTHRGRGLAGVVLSGLLGKARGLGMQRISLETGSRPVFAPAVRFYARHGFQICGPFDGYKDDPESIFMTRLI